MITYTSRKRSFATFSSDQENDPPTKTLPTPPTSSPRANALQPTSGNTQKHLQTKTLETSAKPSVSSPKTENATPPSSPPLPTLPTTSLTSSNTLALSPDTLSTLPHPTSPPLTQNTEPPAKVPKPNMKKSKTKTKLTQLTIDLGGPPQRRCKVCGMEYIPHNAQDRALHASFHAASVGGVDVPGALRREVRVVGRVAPRMAKGMGEKVGFGRGVGKNLGKGRGGRYEDDVIVEVGREDKKSARRLAERVLAIAEGELGAVTTGEERLWGTVPVRGIGDKRGQDEGKDRVLIGKERAREQTPRFKVFLYLRASKCVGLALAERISGATRMAADASTEEEAFDAGNDTETGPREETEISTSLGISRIWVSKEHQRCGIATEMLEAARGKFLLGVQIQRGGVAFSQPTEAGLALIRRWSCCGGVEGEGEEKRKGWLMYDERDVVVVGEGMSGLY